jgi:hypothetical protein
MEKYFEMNPVQGAPPIAAPEIPIEASGPGLAHGGSKPVAPVPVEPSD